MNTSQSIRGIQGNKHTNQLVRELKHISGATSYATIAFILWPLPFPGTGEDVKRSYRIAFLKHFTTALAQATSQYHLSNGQKVTLHSMFYSCLCVANDAQIEVFKERFGPPYWITGKSVGKLPQY